MPDTATLCGALVSGPYENTAAEDGPVREGTDLYENDRWLWRGAPSPAEAFSDHQFPCATAACIQPMACMCVWQPAAAASAHGQNWL